MIKLIERDIGYRTWELGDKHKIRIACYASDSGSIWYIRNIQVHCSGPEERNFVRALFELAKQGGK